jgi:hypothetical protein
LPLNLLGFEFIFCGLEFAAGASAKSRGPRRVPWRFSEEVPAFCSPSSPTRTLIPWKASMGTRQPVAVAGGSTFDTLRPTLAMSVLWSLNSKGRGVPECALVLSRSSPARRCSGRSLSFLRSQHCVDDPVGCRSRSDDGLPRLCLKDRPPGYHSPSFVVSVRRALLHPQDLGLRGFPFRTGHVGEVCENDSGRNMTPTPVNGPSRSGAHKWLNGVSVLLIGAPSP